MSTNWEATQTVTKFISHQIWANQSPKEHNYTVCALSMYSYLQQYRLGGAQHIVSMDSWVDSWVALHANSRFCVRVVPSCVGVMSYIRDSKGLFGTITTTTIEYLFFAQQQIKQRIFPETEAFPRTQLGDYHEYISPTNGCYIHLQLLRFQC